jgi:hypothetical protein
MGRPRQGNKENVFERVAADHRIERLRVPMNEAVAIVAETRKPPEP